MSVLLERPLVELSRKNLPICILDDEPDHVELTSKRLEAAGFPVTGTTNAEEALQKVRSGSCRVVVADLKMPEMDGLAFLEKALQCDPGMYVILVTGFYAVDSAIEAIKHGAYDYLCKPIEYMRLLKTLDDLTDSFMRGLQIRDLEDKLLDSLLFHRIVGRSPAMLEVFDLAKKIARHYTNALITGPTGSGKELVAHALHQMSPVSQERFAVCNCSALVDTLLESQLFGHVRGSFTGATETRPGLFEYANGGAVFLDEIGETSLQLQAKLLRVIENREIQPVGSPEVRKVDVRLIAATNRDLRAEVLADRFREDLFYRLSRIELRVPGLAQRPGDIPILVQHFVKKYGETYGKPFQGLTRRAHIVLLQHDWPGNVRELENVIASTAITANSDFIDVCDLPEHLQRSQRLHRLRRHRVEPASAGRGSQRAHTTRAGNVQWQPGAHCPGTRDWPHQPVSLLEALGQTGGAGCAALGMTIPTVVWRHGVHGATAETTDGGQDRVEQDGSMTRQTSPSNGFAALADFSTQRSERIALQFAIEVCGFDRCGHFFNERSETCNVSIRGCKF